MSLSNPISHQAQLCISIPLPFHLFNCRLRNRFRANIQLIYLLRIPFHIDLIRILSFRVCPVRFSLYVSFESQLSISIPFPYPVYLSTSKPITCQYSVNLSHLNPIPHSYLSHIWMLLVCPVRSSSYDSLESEETYFVSISLPLVAYETASTTTYN